MMDSADKLAGLRKSVTILGATGSVGASTIDLIDHARRTGEADIEVVGLTAHSNADALAEAAIRVGASHVAIADEAALPRLRDALGGHDITIHAGPAGLCALAEVPCDWVMAAIVGVAGLAPVLSAARRGADIAIANKECLVCAGELLIDAIARGGGRLLPTDSEHNAIFQVLERDNADQVVRLILTASGGPFRTHALADMAAITPEMAVAHPVWDMGAKISVDSATMMNKGLELIEAARLFPVHRNQIDIVVHPQSVVHSMVEYADGSVLAQMGTPDMRIPIASALAWPRRMSSPAPRLDLVQQGHLTFEAPDEQRFPALRLAREALETGHGATAVLNAANEVAVAAFLTGRLPFLGIARLVEEVLSRWNGAGGANALDLEEMLGCDAAGRRLADALIDDQAA